MWVDLGRKWDIVRPIVEISVTFIALTCSCCQTSTGELYCHGCGESHGSVVGFGKMVGLAGWLCGQNVLDRRKRRRGYVVVVVVAAC